MIARIELDDSDADNSKVVLFQKDIKSDLQGQIEYVKHDECFCFRQKQSKLSNAKTSNKNMATRIQQTFYTSIILWSAVLWVPKNTWCSGRANCLCQEPPLWDFCNYTLTIWQNHYGVEANDRDGLSCPGNALEFISLLGELAKKTMDISWLDFYQLAILRSRALFLGLMLVWFPDLLLDQLSKWILLFC